MVSMHSCSGGTDLSYFGEVAIFCDILSRLPVKSLMRFKLVCTDWRLLIEKDSSFMNLQLTRSKSKTNLLVFPLHNPRCVGAETRLILFSGKEGEESSPGPGAVVPRDLLLLLSCRNVVYTDFSIPLVVEMLKPVNGLVCFQNDFSGSVLIFNPSTRRRTCWIRTNIEIEIEEHLRASKLTVSSNIQTKTWSRSYGFGFDPIASEHKVVCVYKISSYTRSSVNVVSCVQKEIICEVLTVGENRWRKIDAVPLCMVGKSVYINGYIYWMGYQKSSFTQSNVILGFSVTNERFDRVIKIPDFMLDLWCFKKNNRVSRWLVSELVAFDGRLAIIDREGDRWINLWIYKDDSGNSIVNGGDCNWTKETIPMPYVWDGQGFLAMEHIPGTDIIMVQCFGKSPEIEFGFYYNRAEQEIYTKQVEFICTTRASSSPNCSGCPDHSYQVTSFFQTLFPVQTKM